MVDILTLNYNDAETTIQFVDSVKNYSCVSHVLVVDNHSTDNSLNLLKKIEADKVVVIASEKNGGYGAGNNLGIRYLTEHFHSEYILLANPDVIVDEKTLKSLQNFLMKKDDYALAAPFMLNANGLKMYNTAYRIPNPLEYVLSQDILISKFVKPFYYPNLDKETCAVKDVDAVSGSMFMMNAKHMLKHGMYDEKMFLYCEEMVLAVKFRNANLKTALLCQDFFIHNHSVSIKKSFKSAMSRHSLFEKSKLYVIENYFKVSRFEWFLAKALAKISNIEIFLISVIRGSK